MSLTRRHLLASSALLAAKPQRKGGITLNEDANHFFVARRKQRITHELIRQWVDQYANTQVTDLVLNVNAMRSSFPSRHREAWWTGFDPKGDQNQPFFKALPESARQTWYEWIRCSWEMNEDKLDLYAIWIPEIRRRNISPWISVRMNDLHEVDKEDHAMHSSFWRENKQFRRVPYRNEQRDKALDFAHKEVRDYNFRYIEEVAERYDFDTLELDWMRFGFHFRPGHEAEGSKILTDYHTEVRKLLNQWERKRKHKIGLAVRVPSNPRTSKRLGMDAETWTQLGLVNYVTPTNFWRTVDNNMPMDIWRKLLPKTTTLAAGLELGCNAFPGSIGTGNRPWQSNSLETTRGSAAAYWHMGIDKLYLFNYMDADTTLDDPTEYPQVLRELTNNDKPRRHVVTYQDTWAPGETPWAALPANLEPNRYAAFRLLIGPTAKNATVRLGLTNENVTVRVNNTETSPGQLIAAIKPGPNIPLYEFKVPQVALQPGENVIEVTAQSPTRIEWVELYLSS